MKCIKLSQIVTTAGTQIRARIDADTVEQYAEAMLDAANKFPPVVVFHDGSQYILADGFHRVMAASRNNFLDIEADVRKGTKADALKYALGANATHGLKRTNADKRRSVELALTEWPKMSDREIARVCAVGNALASEIRNCLNQTVEQPQTRIGADGKERRVPSRAKSTPPPPEPAQEQEAQEPEPEPEPTPEPQPQPDDLKDRVLAWLHNGLKKFSVEELPRVRTILREELAKTEEHDRDALFFS